VAGWWFTKRFIMRPNTFGCGNVFIAENILTRWFWRTVKCKSRIAREAERIVKNLYTNLTHAPRLFKYVFISFS
jgi:hypothetical protein